MDYNKITHQWNDVHHYSPAPRHRRRLILKIINKLSFDSILDVGCAQPYLLNMINKENRKFFGCDISEKVITENRDTFSDINFEVLDISKEIYQGNRTFDLLVCSEVLEHIENWEIAIKNLSTMTKKYLLITVPKGKVHGIDKIVGHVRHFEGNELICELGKNGFKILSLKYWGFPIHWLYKYAINSIAKDKIYDYFAVSKYGLIKKLFSIILYCLFFLNDFFNSGNQLIVLGEKSDIK